MKRAHLNDTRGRNLIAFAKALAALTVTATLFPLQVMVRALMRGPVSFALPQLWHRALCHILAIRIERVGDADPRSGTVYVGNHLSHFDIFVMGACVRAAFIAKDDMAIWPGMRLLGAMQHTLFVSRRARAAARVAEQVASMRRQGQRLILFAEGTTSSGVTVAPFKSSLFAVLVSGADSSRVPASVQPFTLQLLEVDGQPLLDASDRDLYAFYGGASAGEHVWRFLRSRGARVRVTLHAPIAITPGITRKTLAAAAHAVVIAELERGVQVGSPAPT